MAPDTHFLFIQLTWVNLKGILRSFIQDIDDPDIGSIWAGLAIWFTSLHSRVTFQIEKCHAADNYVTCHYLTSEPWHVLRWMTSALLESSESHFSIVQWSHVTVRDFHFNWHWFSLQLGGIDATCGKCACTRVKTKCQSEQHRAMPAHIHVFTIVCLVYIFLGGCDVKI